MGLAIAGIGLERRWLVWVAIAVLAVAFLMRFLKSPTGRSLGRDDPPAG
jgi:ABC-type branched-subunit amino acid transport system permease subunit